MITFLELLARLQSQDPMKSLIFTSADGEVGAGYHITELRHSVSNGIDCGGDVATWEDAKLQILDGHGSEHMTVGKFTDIVEKSLSVLPQLRELPLLVEFGHNNERLTIMSLHGPEVSDTAVVLTLGNARAVCKPAMRSGRAEKVQGRCCESVTPSPQKSSCCGASTASQDVTASCA